VMISSGMLVHGPDSGVRGGHVTSSQTSPNICSTPPSDDLITQTTGRTFDNEAIAMILSHEEVFSF
jgi:hypothetical protein